MKMNKKFKKNIAGITVLVLCLLFSVSGFAAEETHPDLAQPSQSIYSSPVQRLASGFGNIVYGPLEIIYQLKEEMKRTDPIRGLIPGVLRGVSWFGAREVVGVFEIVTFFLPLQPHLEPFSTSWLSA